MFRIPMRLVALRNRHPRPLCTFENECFNACGIDPSDSMIYCEAPRVLVCKVFGNLRKVSAVILERVNV